MAKNRYPDSLGLSDCGNFYEIFDKLRNFYGIQSWDYKDVIVEILLQQHEINRSENNSSQMQKLFECVAKDYVPDTYKASGAYLKEHERTINERCDKNDRQGLIIAMFELLMKRGLSQNRTAQIIESKGMSKGVKRRYHEAKKNESAVRTVFIHYLVPSITEDIGRLKNDPYRGLESLIRDYKQLQ